MPILIGAKRESDFKDPIGMLGDCHRRIERFLNALLTVATDAKGGPLSNEQQTALATGLRYFREAAPKHTADEEESLFPRLRRLDHPDLQPLLAKVDSLQQDHEFAEKSHREVDHLGQLWLASGRLSSHDAGHLTALLSQLEELYRRHIAMEDTEIFPFAANVLALSDREAFGAEMAARRGIGTTESPALVKSASACDNLREDHREMEVYLDRLLAAFQRLGPERVAEVEAAVRDIRRLSLSHFEKEEVIFYPSLRSAFPDLMAQLDQQHEEVREVEQHVGDLLSDPPPIPDSRWLNDVQLFGTELCDRIQHHIMEEEDQLFRLAETRLTAEDQERLTVEMKRVHGRLPGP